MARPPDIATLLPLLPHRYPMPLVDRVLECEPGRFARGIKNVTMNEPCFTGHFPSYPVMPGVLVLEALIQLCAVLAAASGHLPADGSVRLTFPGVPNCRFKRQVVPGDTLTLECSLVPADGVPTAFSVCARVDGEMAVEAEIAARLSPVGAGDAGA
jgi:3-hydroxyacyl-[acyl-carrier-protein] dehydratase